MITSNEFINLSKGDMIQYRVGEVWFRTKCIGDAFYNADANEPGWEVETEDCNLSMYNDIVIEKKHEPKEFVIRLILTENDIEALEDKVGYSIEDKQDAYEAVCEAISTFIEL